MGRISQFMMFSPYYLTNLNYKKVSPHQVKCPFLIILFHLIILFLGFEYFLLMKTHLLCVCDILGVKFFFWCELEISDVVKHLIEHQFSWVHILGSLCQFLKKSWYNIAWNYYVRIELQRMNSKWQFDHFAKNFSVEKVQNSSSNVITDLNIIQARL